MCAGRHEGLQRRHRGHGRTAGDRAGLLQQLANLPQHPESVPMNMLVRVQGTPLADEEDLDPFEFIRTIAVARIMMPASHVRLSAGREEMNEQMHALAYFAGANSIFYGEKLLTTPNPRPTRTWRCFHGWVSNRSSGRWSGPPHAPPAVLRRCSHLGRSRGGALRSPGRGSGAASPADLYRRRLTLDSAQGPLVQLGERQYLNFCSNDYLGLAAHPRVVARFPGGCRVRCRQRRLSSGLRPQCSCIRSWRRRWPSLRAARALLFSSGYMANTGILTSLLQRGDHVFEDRLNHASLLDGGLHSGARFQRFAHSTSVRWSEAARPMAAAGC